MADLVEAAGLLGIEGDEVDVDDEVADAPFVGVGEAAVAWVVVGQLGFGEVVGDVALDDDDDGDGDGDTDVDRAGVNDMGACPEDDRAIEDDLVDDAATVEPGPEGWGAPTSTRDELGVDAAPVGSDPITKPSRRRSCAAPVTCGSLPMTRDEWVLPAAWSWWLVSPVAKAIARPRSTMPTITNATFQRTSVRRARSPLDKGLTHCRRKTLANAVTWHGQSHWDGRFAPNLVGAGMNHLRCSGCSAAGCRALTSRRRSMRAPFSEETPADCSMIGDSLVVDRPSSSPEQRPAFTPMKQSES